MKALYSQAGLIPRSLLRQTSSSLADVQFASEASGFDPPGTPQLAAGRIHCLIIAFVVLATAPSTFAQQLPTPILVWLGGAPGATGTSDEDKPAIIPVLPAEADNTGAAVLVCPGGGFTTRAVDHEGVLVSQWFRKRGIA